MRISSFYYDEATKVTMVYLQQTHKGVDVYNAITPVAFKNDKPVSVRAVLPLAEVMPAEKSAKPAVTAAAALRTAAAALNLALRADAVAG